MPTHDPAHPTPINAALAEVRRRSARRLARRRTLAAGVTVILAVAVVASATASGGHLNSRRIQVGTSPHRGASDETPTPTVPRFSTAPAVPAVIYRPLHLPVLHPGQACPTSTGRPFAYTGFVGTALGDGPVRVTVANPGDLVHGEADLGATADPGWLALKTLWFASPAYDGPFLVRGQRIDSPGILDEGGGQAPSPVPLVVPAGPTNNTFGGYRTQNDGAWVTAPGCYAWQVDGLTFSYIIVVDMRSAVLDGTLTAVGEAPGIRERPLAGTVTISSSELPAITVPVGADGRFSVPVLAGTYTLTGHSPSVAHAAETCKAANPITVTTVANPAPGNAAHQTIIVACPVR